MWVLGIPLRLTVGCLLQQGGTYSVRSTISMDPAHLALSDTPPLPGGRRPFVGFKRAVRQRMLTDLNVLPVRDPTSHFVERQHITVYADELAKQVLIVYTPTAASLEPGVPALKQAQIECLLFTLCITA